MNKQPKHSHAYLLPALNMALSRVQKEKKVLRLFDAGCGSGFFAGHLSLRGYHVAACDISSECIGQARNSHPGIRFDVMSICDDLAGAFGDDWDVCICMEVIEHVYDPRGAIRAIKEILVPGGLLILSTPYHGYLKNVALAVSGKMDPHFSALWDGGHIKFWSYNTIKALLSEQQFSGIEFHGAGRLPYLWKSMVISAINPPG